MAPLPPESTARVYLDYSVAGFDHTAICRFDTGATIQDAVDGLQALVTALDPVLYLSSFVGLRASNLGSNVSYPLANTFSTTWGDGGEVGDETAKYFDLVGRSVDGRRVRVAMFGAVNLVYANKYRIPSDAASWVADAIAAVQDAEGAFVTISSQEAVWKPYINLGVNAYWRNKIR